MTALRSIQTNFTAGELDLDALGRSDLAAYANGARELTNVQVAPTGGVSRRPGLAHVDAVPGKGRLIPMALAGDGRALLVVTHGRLLVYRAGQRVADLAAPWLSKHLPGLRWAQSADVMLLTHPEVPPQRLIYRGGDTWQLADWAFFRTQAGAVREPLVKFAPAGTTLQPDGTSGTVTLTASSEVFKGRDHVGATIEIKGKQAEITVVDSATQVQAETREALVDTQATIDWRESAVSAARGWPVAVAFHQDRLVIGGTRDRPQRLWLSRTGDLFNFYLGEGKPDNAIAMDLLGDQIEAITALKPGRHLQIFTARAEWRLAGEPLTPAQAQLQRHTRHGSPVARYVPPADVEGETVFVPRQGGQIRAFRPDELAQRYASTDLALLAPHLVPEPVDAAYDSQDRIYYALDAGGTLAAATLLRGEQVTAWTRLATAHPVAAVAAQDGAVHVLVERPQGWHLERLAAGYQTDAALTGSSDSPQTTWSGLGHLEGATVRVRADGADVGAYPVRNGQIELDAPASAIEAGLAYRSIVTPLPPGGNRRTGPLGPGAATRLVRCAFQLHATQALAVDTGTGLAPVPLQRLPASEAPATPAPFTGIVHRRGRGWQPGGDRPLWRISQDAPLPATILAVTSEIVVSLT